MLLILVVTTLSIITLLPFGPPNGQGGEDPTGVQIVWSDQLPSLFVWYVGTSPGIAPSNPAV